MVMMMMVMMMMMVVAVVVVVVVRVMMMVMMMMMVIVFQCSTWVQPTTRSHTKKWGLTLKTVLMMMVACCAPPCHLVKHQHQPKVRHPPCHSLHPQA